MADKVVLISGGTSGIGRAAVEQLLEDGFLVAAFGPKPDKCKTLAKELGQVFNADKFLIIPGDVKKEPILKKVVQATIKKFKKLDVLINNAGYGFFNQPDEIDISKYRDMMEVNMVGMAALTKLVIPVMKKREQGLIINIASVAGRQVGQKGSFYSSTKFAVMGYSEGLRKDLAAFGIKVTTVCPGMVRTNFFNQKELERRKQELWQGKDPVMLDAGDIARAIGFICSQPQHVSIYDILVMPFGN